jgi:hypothetical protein
MIAYSRARPLARPETQAPALIGKWPIWSSVKNPEAID